MRCFIITGCIEESAFVFKNLSRRSYSIVFFNEQGVVYQANVQKFSGIRLYRCISTDCICKDHILNLFNETSQVVVKVRKRGTRGEKGGSFNCSFFCLKVRIIKFLTALGESTSLKTYLSGFGF